MSENFLSIYSKVSLNSFDSNEILVFEQFRSFEIIHESIFMQRFLPIHNKKRLFPWVYATSGILLRTLYRYFFQD